MKHRGQNRQQQQTQPRVTVGRRQVAPVLQSPVAKMRADIEAREKRSARERELASENAQLRRDAEFHQLDRQCQEIMMLRIPALKLSEEEATRQAHVLNGGMARHKAEGKSAKRFDPYSLLKEDEARHGRGVPVPKTSGLDARLPPPRPEATVRNGLASVPGDQAAHEAQFRAAQQRGQSEAERERLAREDYRERLRRLKLSDPAVGSFPGGGGFFS